MDKIKERNRIFKGLAISGLGDDLDEESQKVLEGFLKFHCLFLSNDKTNGKKNIKREEKRLKSVSFRLSNVCFSRFVCICHLIFNHIIYSNAHSFIV